MRIADDTTFSFFVASRFLLNRIKLLLLYCVRRILLCARSFYKTINARFCRNHPTACSLNSDLAFTLVHLKYLHPWPSSYELNEWDELQIRNLKKETNSKLKLHVGTGFLDSFYILNQILVDTFFLLMQLDLDAFSARKQA